ncbi:hypothetical protein Pla8534_23050 [Lignipirellula cremea]|uniref:Primase C-terminal 1 domain-containing protein n=2 Tax=Lignipirellula cremea TaxID=2528010 RepID=A0A518DRS2_9BACT|nr:hypothetical protein Pla8534_23050 [Lignipirellula cremea]
MNLTVSTATGPSDLGKDSTVIVDFLKLLHPSPNVFEIRSLKCPEKAGAKFTSTAAGYFNHHHRAAGWARNLDKNKPPGVYVTLNPVKPVLLARSDNQIVFRQGSGMLTQDGDITCRQWLFVDIDSVRENGMSATDTEVAAADNVASDIAAELFDTWKVLPLRCMSGNGAYLLYRIELPNDDPSRDLIRAVLHGLAARFNSDGAAVDTSTFNAGRILKVMGTHARKGSDFKGGDGGPGGEGRPHRQSFFRVPKGEPGSLSLEQLQAIAAWSTAFEQPKICQPREQRPRNINPEKALARYRNYMQSIPDAISGQDGHGRTFHAACEAFKFGLTEDVALKEMRWFNDNKTNEPWKEHELKHKVHDARKAVERDGEFGCRINTSQPPRNRFRDSTSSSPGLLNADHPAPWGFRINGRLFLMPPTTPPVTPEKTEKSLPEVWLPGGCTPIRVAASELGNLMKTSGVIFQRGVSIVAVKRGALDALVLEEIKDSKLASLFEDYACLVGEEGKPTICNRAKAKLILDADAFRNEFPRIDVISPCPVLVEAHGRLEELSGGQFLQGIYADGKPAATVSVGKAINILSQLVDEFNFVTPSDRSRAIASLITPALVMSGLLGDRCPMDLTEADEQQTGKGYRNKLTAAIYGQKVQAITERKRGVGGLEEDFSSKLLAGHTFISLDNMRGRVGSV